MSLYNALFGENKLRPLLLKVLGIDQPDGEFDSGRFRDIYLNGDGTRIILYTRNGGGNRDEYQYVLDNFSENHPNYIKDYDDDFDCTYAYVEFSVPDGYKEELKDLATGVEPKKVGEAFQELFKDMESGKDTEAVQRSKKVAEKIIGAINSSQNGGIITIDPDDGENKEKS